MGEWRIRWWIGHPFQETIPDDDNDDDEAIFVDRHGVSGVKRNCIYFTDDDDEAIFVDRHGVRDLGVFNMEDGSIERYFYKQRLFPPPIWFMPNLP
ncbi:hypothetical protein QJS10_CPB20g00689 [Acorus calamus]|uniref:DUF295 domain-containing protein n=1 Tax=Acorus calamus TaxID=4465 RepID=A0AAV9C7Q7_ACOCL|nr:hypothetical protein QJS10_CPB20g00689 [Acorus calamus]